MANLPHWDTEFEEWDSLALGPFPRLPGVWDVEDGNVKRIVDIKKAPGRDGATVKDEGYENGRFRLVGQFLAAEDWQLMQEVLDTIHPKKRGKASEPFSISHPKLSALSVFAVRVIEVQVPRIDNGIMTVTIEVLEFVKAPPKAKKPKENPYKDPLPDSPDYLSYEAPDGLDFPPSR